MSERNQGKNNEYDTGDLHTVCACVDDAASDSAQKMDIRLTLLMDLLQLPLSLIFTRFLNLFSAVILVFGEAYPNQLAGSYAGDRRHGT